MIDQSLAHYKVAAKLGQGGMGAVYRATDIKLGRQVAIKVLPESLAQDRERLARFEREAKGMTSLDPRNIVDRRRGTPGVPTRYSHGTRAGYRK